MADNSIRKSNNLFDDTPITGDESDKLISNAPQNCPGSVTELNDPPQKGPGPVTEDEPDRLLSIRDASLNRDSVVNANVPPSITKIELTLNLKHPSPDAEDAPDNLSNYKIEINLFEKQPSADLPAPEDDQQECEEVQSIHDQQECEAVQSIDDRLLKAAISGKYSEVLGMVAHDAQILLGITPHGSTCLHIASLFGHQKFFEEVVALNQSLLSKVNSYDETPLIVAVKSGHVSLASAMLEQYRHQELKDMILQPDNKEDNVLHHAIRDGHGDLALKLIAAEPDLSQGVNKYKESPLYIAVSRGFSDVSVSLLKISHCSYSGPHDENALHAAVRNGDPG